MTSHSHVITYIQSLQKYVSVEYVVRSHEVKHEGYEVAHNGKCITVFSAPNYW